MFRIWNCRILLLFSFCGTAYGADARLLFAGDLLLGRQVQREIAATGLSPWHRLAPLLEGADWRMANFEGAVGDSGSCAGKPAALCFAVRPADMAWLRGAGFAALGLANNHAFDLGPEGAAATRSTLAGLGIAGVGFEESPRFFDVNGTVLGVVALSLVPDGQAPVAALPGVELAQKLRLARRLAQLVVVSVHWGYELQDWPSAEQREQARWLVEQGADLVVGHHPHVVQPPACVDGRPVFYSLGNHLFDQKYPATKDGLLAECRVGDGVLRCQGLRTRTPSQSSYPAPAGENPAAFQEVAEGCPVPLGKLPEVNGYLLRPRSEGGRVRLEGWLEGRRLWESAPLPLLGLAWGRLASPPGEELLLTLERRHSPIDGEEGVRPYVYALGPQGPVARWRGSALAWPLLDAVLLPTAPPRLCALHRGDSFLVPDPATESTRTLVYGWNGFGFSGVEDREGEAACADYFGKVAVGSGKPAE